MSSEHVLPPEMRLLLAAARAPLPEAALRQVRELASSHLNWDNVARIADRHQITPLLYNALKIAGGMEIPLQTLRTLGVKAVTTASRNRLFADELVRLNRLLLDHGCSVLFYKGATAALALYGDLALRAFNDIDFLVRRADLDTVCAVLAKEGYAHATNLSQREKAIEEYEQKEYCFKKGPITLEPHWSITARRFPFDIDYDSFWKGAREMAFNGSHCLTFGPEDMLLVLCVCGCKGQWKRLQMVTDVAQVVATYPELDWRRCVERSERARSGRMLRMGLLLAQELLQTELPDEITAYIRRDSTAASLADSVIKDLSFSTQRPPRRQQTASYFSSMLFRMRETPGDKLRYLVRTTTTPRLIHLRRLPLSDRMFWAYRIFVPMHDYIATPLAQIFRQHFSKERDPND